MEKLLPIREAFKKKIKSVETQFGGKNIFTKSSLVRRADNN